MPQSIILLTINLNLAVKKPIFYKILTNLVKLLLITLLLCIITNKMSKEIMSI